MAFTIHYVNIVHTKVLYLIHCTARALHDTILDVYDPIRAAIHGAIVIG
jgi:hypothetical protein